jgi:CRP/FNR family cyclic AMP-dependent transcriptional regulator
VVVNNGLTITDKIIQLKSIAIFGGLSVRELSAVASFAEEQKSGAGEVVFRENDVGEMLYVLFEGEVSIIKGYQTEKQSEFSRMQASNYFGEMALFDDGKRSATIRAEMPSRFLTLHKFEFSETVREYPQIALNAIKVLSGRLRSLGVKVAESRSCRDLPRP